VLGTVGVGVLGFGAFTLVTTLRFDQLLGLAVWLAGAVVVHDAVFAPLTAVVSGILERGGRRLPQAASLCLRLGFAVGVVLSLLAVPAIYAQSRGQANPTILTADYALRLGIVWVVVLVAVALITVVLITTRGPHQIRPRGLRGSRRPS
jgi:hypothetical protein